MTRGRVIPAVVVALTASAGLAGSAGSATPASPQVAFVRFAPKIGRPLVFTAAVGSRRARMLPVGSPAAQGPAWSPDGARLVFVGGQNASDPTYVSTNVDLYLASANGAHVRRITRNAAREAAPAWSPDGRKLVFVRSAATGNRSSLWVIGADGGRARRLTSGNVDLQPAWSPRGDQIAFVRISRTYESGIWVVRPDGSGLHRILAEMPGVTEPQWSPDGRRLLLTDGKTLLTVRTDGSARRTLVELTADARGGLEDPQPSWSRDGRWVAFCQFRAGVLQRSDLWIVGADGRGLRGVTRSPGLDTDPSIRP